MSETRIELHGWDSVSCAWHGPDELAYSLAGCRTILRRLRQFPGSWYGRLRGQIDNSMPISFCAFIHDLGDAGLGVIDLDGSPGGPLEVVLVAPFERRSRFRQELAFEFVSYLRFLEGPISSGRELVIHDYIERVLASPAPDTTLVFSIETRAVEPDLQFQLSQQVERMAMSMIAWMAEKDRLERQVVRVHGAPSGIVLQ